METVNNGNDHVTVNDVVSGTVYDELESESGYYSSGDRTFPEVYSGLQRSTRELPPPPVVYDRLTRHDYVNQPSEPTSLVH